MDYPIISAIERTTIALEQRHSARWILGFSGGKDSSAALKIVLAAHKRARIKPQMIELLYCDTGVENPILDGYIRKLFAALSVEPNLPVSATILKSPLHDRFFVKIIGRGYPPPTNSFRWCTNGLRIRPIAEEIKKLDPNNAVVVLGIRKSESFQRDRTIGKQIDPFWQKQTEGSKSYDIFAPIVEMSVASVWDAVFCLDRPRSIDPSYLENLYRDASGECPVIKSPQSPPCASGRFGCWTCTVVRKDKSSTKLVDAGYSELLPYLKFRNWLAEIRNDPNRRWPTRRSGAPGMGPFTIEARKEILARLDRLEQIVGVPVLDAGERGLIASLWELDHIARLRFPKAN